MSEPTTTSAMEEIRARLTPVRRRLLARAILLACERGLWLGAIVALLLAVLEWAGREVGLSLPGLLLPGGAAIVVLLGLLGGVWTGWRRRPTWPSAAATVDSHYQLHDTVLAAIQFAERTGGAAANPFEGLQVALAMQTLDRLDLRAAAPLAIPTRLCGTALLLIVAATLFAWPIGQGPAQPAQTAPLAEPLPAANGPADKSPVQESLRAAAPAAEPVRPGAESAESLLAALQWHVASNPEPDANRSGVRFQETLEQAVRAGLAARAATAPEKPTRGGAVSQASWPVMPSAGPIPPEYRPAVRGYFQKDR